jgi:hypothetical protein
MKSTASIYNATLREPGEDLTDDSDEQKDRKSGASKKSSSSPVKSTKIKLQVGCSPSRIGSAIYIGWLILLHYLNAVMFMMMVSLLEYTTIRINSKAPVYRKVYVAVKL